MFYTKQGFFKIKVEQLNLPSLGSAWLDCSFTRLEIKLILF